MTLLDESFAAFVNLDSRPDRLEHMAAELERIGLDAVRRPGRDPSEWAGNPEDVQTMLGRTPGALGCWMAQRAVMDEALEIGRHAFVMEDDLIFCSDLHERLEIVADYLDGRRWDVLWLGGTYHVNPAVWHVDTLGRDAERTDHPRILRTYGAFSTHAYIVRAGSIPRVTAMLDAMLPTSIGIDTSFIAIQPHLRAYAFAPGCVIQRDDTSNIGTGRTIFSGFAKLGAHWYADTMTDFDPDAYAWAEAALSEGDA